MHNPWSIWKVEIVKLLYFNILITISVFIGGDDWYTANYASSALENSWLISCSISLGFLNNFLVKINNIYFYFPNCIVKLLTFDWFCNHKFLVFHDEIIHNWSVFDLKTLKRENLLGVAALLNVFIGYIYIWDNIYSFFSIF